MNVISLSELKNRLAATPAPMLVEALSARYFAQWHLPGAVNLDVGDVKVKAPALLPNKDAEIVTYCASETCTNSDQVAAQLQALGYTRVAVFKGGKAAWEAARLPKAGASP